VLEYLAANDIGGGCARVSGRSTWGHFAPIGPHSRLGELFPAGAINARQLRPGSRDLRTQIAGIDTVLAEAAYTSPLTALALSVDEDTTLEDHWARPRPTSRAR
jgi:hypothetical protein